jgi:hypothetical protein
MGYKWRPNASQRKAFAEKMKDPDEQKAYQERKYFNHSYEGFKDKNFIPTKEQHDFCFNHMELFTTIEEQSAMNEIMSSYVCQEKVNHQYIHIVNEKRRNYESNH